MTFSLKALERWFQSTITHPKGAVAGARSRAARAFLDRPLEDIATASRQLEASERLDIYATSYWLRLLECLGEDYPALKAALGEALFESVCRRYLQRHPSSHFSLSALGARLPAFLKSNAAGKLAHRGFLSSLAELERTIQEIFDAPFDEPLKPEALTGVSGPALQGLVFHPIRAARILELSCDANAWYQSFREGEKKRPPRARAASFVLVLRYEDRVYRQPLAPMQAHLLTLLMEETPLGSALEAVAARRPRDASKMLRSIGSWFESFGRAGLFREITLRTR